MEKIVTEKMIKKEKMLNLLAFMLKQYWDVDEESTMGMLENFKEDKFSNGLTEEQAVRFIQIASIPKEDTIAILMKMEGLV